MIIILCEGQTEERFVKEIISEKFNCVQPKIIMTRSGKEGGSVTYDSFIDQCKKHLKNKQVDLLITMFDFAGLPKSWFNNSYSDKCPKKLNERIKKDLKDERIFPVWMMHEFEIIAFINTNITCDVIGNDKYKSALDNVIKNCNHDPEKINDNNYPSHRLKNIYNEYQKIIDGISIAKKLGIEKLCETNSFKRLFDKLKEIKC